MVESIEGSAGAIVIDDRYSPLIVTSFMGDVDLQVGTWYEKTIQRIIERETLYGRRVVNVHDASRSTRTSPEMRKFWAEMSARNHATMDAKMLGNIVVITSPLMRGVLTAVGWLNPRVASLQVFASVDSAVTEALEILEAAGTPAAVPEGGYKLPTQSVTGLAIT